MSLSIGLHVKQKLCSSSGLASLVANRIYPLIAPEGVASFPYVFFDTSTNEPTFCKTGVAEDNHSIIVTCVAKGYEESLRIAEAVRDALDFEDSDQTSFEVTQCHFISRTEDFVPDMRVFTQSLTFAAITCDL